MKSLQTNAAISILKAKEYLIADAIVVVDAPLTQNDNILAMAADDDEFWKFLINTEYGVLLIHTRMDIGEGQWQKFARLLANDIVSRYRILGNWGNVVVDEGPILTYHGPRNDQYFAARHAETLRPEPDNDIHEINFDVLGVKPENECLGYVTRFYFDDPIQVAMSEPRAFICLLDNTAKCFSMLATYLAVNFRTLCMQHLQDHFAEGGTGIEIRHRKFLTMPLIDELFTLFIEMLNSDMADVGIKMSDFIENILRYRDYIFCAYEPGHPDHQYLTMFIDVGQLKFIDKVQSN